MMLIEIVYAMCFNLAVKNVGFYTSATFAVCIAFSRVYLLMSNTVTRTFMNRFS